MNQLPDQLDLSRILEQGTKEKLLSLCAATKGVIISVQSKLLRARSITGTSYTMQYTQPYYIVHIN